MRPSLFRILFLFLIFTGNAPAENTVAETSDTGNTYMAGGNLRLDSPVAADLIAAGGQISIEREIGADAALAGGTVHVRAPVMQDLRVAGGSVRVEQDVGGDLMAAGAQVDVDRNAQIAGSARLAGRDVRLAGSVARDVKIYGETVTVSGHIGGNARLYGRQLILAPSARIDGDLSYASPDALPDQVRAQVGGAVTRLETPEGWQVRRAGAVSWFHPLFLVSMLVCGMVLYLLFPHAVAGSARAIARYPLRSLLSGLALLFALPPVAVLLMVTMIGLPLGLALLLLYPLVLLLGYLAAAFFVSQRAAFAFRQQEPLTLKRQALFLALALLVLGLVIALPFVGGLILFLAIVTGIGGWAVWAHARYGSGASAADAQQVSRTA